MKNKNIRKCRYCDCEYANKEIDISSDAFIVKGNMYFHEKCYNLKVSKSDKTEKQKKDLQLIKTLWFENISNTVVYSQLFHILNNLIAKGIDSDYLVFTLQYCIEHKLNLNYPGGFPYFVDNKKIKEAYAKKKLTTDSYNKASFIAVEKEDTSPKFSINKKINGFQSILKKNN